MKTILVLMLLAIVALGDERPVSFDGENNVVHNAPSTLVHKPEPRNFDWRFIAAHGVYASSIAFDVYATNKGEHMPCGYAEGGGYGAKTTGTLVRNDLIEFGLILGMDYMLKRTHVPGLSYVGSTIGTAKHLRGGAQWVQHCF